MKEHNKHFYSLEELKRTRDCYEGYLDNEEVYYFVGAIRYACDEIERLDNAIKNQQEDIEEYNDKLNEVVKERNKYLYIINELEKFLNKRINFYHKTNITNYFENKDILDKLQELKGDDKD